MFLKLVSASLCIALLSACSNTSETRPSETRPSDSPSATVETGDVAPSEVYTFFCEIIEQKPEMLSDECATLGTHVRDIQWKTWGSEGAQGTGIYSVRLCDPDCASGGRADAKVKIELSELIYFEKKYLLTKLAIQFDPKANPDFPKWATKNLTWQLDEFYRIMNSDV